MTVPELEKKTGRPAPTPAERQLAAKVRVRADEKRKVSTPKWIRDLANSTR